ncbi:hypothetical protein FDUTEX481_07351 [Tolypothrix sp. PCC 7601]|nr:hypothetical protein FDUTEX481_07351 [Tolypothrix sp. PCC 7601]
MLLGLGSGDWEMREMREMREIREIREVRKQGKNNLCPMPYAPCPLN